MAANEITISVKSQDNTKAGFDSAKATAERGGSDAGDAFTEKLDDKVEEGAEKSGDDGSRSFADRFTSGLKEKMSGSDSTSWASGFLSRLHGIFGGGGGEDSASGIGDDFGKNLAGGIGPGIMGMHGKLLAIMSLGGPLLGALPALGGLAGVGIGVAMIGGIAAELLAQNSKVKSAASKMGTSVLSTLEQTIKPLIPVVLQVFKQIDALMKQIAPELTSVFKTIAPAIEPIFKSVSVVVQDLVGVMKAAAPAFGPFIQGLLSLVKNVLPPLTSGIKATVPFIGEFGKTLGTLGKDLGSIFDSAGPAIKASMTILDDLLKVVGGLLPVIMKLGSVMATTLAPIFAQFGQVIKALGPSLDLIGGIIAKLAEAMMGDLVSAFGAVATLLVDMAPGLKVLAQALGQVFTVLENTGVFATLGDTVEALARPLANLFNILVKSLAPAFPVIIHLVTQLTQIFITLVSAGLTVMINAVAGIIKFLGPLVPVIAAIVGAIKLWSVAQGILNIALDSNPIGLIVLAIAALIGIIVEVVKHFQTFKDIVADAWNAIKSATETVWHWITSFLKTEVSAVETALSWFTKLGGLFRGWWDDAVNAVKTVAGDMITFVEGLPGKILHALGDVGTMLFDAGKKIIEGLVHGIESAVGDVEHAVSGIVDKIKDFLPFSPAKRGPLAGAGAPMNSGLSIARQLAQGMTAGRSAVEAAATSLARTAGVGGGAGGLAGAGAGGSGGTLQIQFTGGGSSQLENAIWEYMKKNVRVKGGGSVQKALGLPGRSS